MARRRSSEPVANPARGAALVVAAVVVGLFLLRNGLDTSEAITSSGGSGGTEVTDTATDEATDDTTDDAPEDTTTTVGGRAPADVPTIVLNGSGVTGAAGRYSEFLTGLGYNLTNPAGGNADANTETTLVYFAPGFEAEAAAVVAAIGAPATVVPATLPTTPPGPIAGASVVVVLGSDIGNLTPTAADGATDAATDGAATDGATTDAATDAAVEG
jgi:hypothetical protein